MTKAAKRILSLAKKIAEDHKNSNLLLEILENFQVEDEEVVIACCSSAGKVFNHFLLKTNFIENESNKDTSKDQQFHNWLLEQYTTTCQILFDYLGNNSISIQISSLEALALIVSGLREKKSKACPSKSNEIIEKIMPVMLDNEQDRNKLISQLPALLPSSGDEGGTVLTCLTCLRQNVKGDEKISKTSDAKAFNIWHVVTQIAGNCELDGKAKSILNKVVLNFLKHEVPIKLYKEILTGIATVMEKMTNPLLLADFLSDSFDIGGAISLMSLNGLFVLMHKYNLNYPDFYEKLYSMFQPQIFGAKYRARFFHLADLFLSSTHLPSYLVAAFVKKLARLSLHAPASGVRIAVPFIFNLIKRHPACDVLLHRTEGDLDFDSDPFLEDESLTKCKALESCVWELRTLEHHFDPNISSKSRKREIKEEDLSNLLDQNITEVMESEAKKRKKDVALAFEKSTDFKLFGKLVL